eukprot:3826547-Prymnesium_polylepis.1
MSRELWGRIEGMDALRAPGRRTPPCFGRARVPAEHEQQQDRNRPLTRLSGLGLGTKGEECARRQSGAVGAGCP